MKFVNGFDSWQETHFEVVSAIKLNEDLENSKVAEVATMEGTGGLYEFAKRLTDEFEQLHKGREWSGEFFEEIEKFLENKL